MKMYTELEKYTVYLKRVVIENGKRFKRYFIIGTQSGKAFDQTLKEII